MEHILHICQKSAWKQAQKSGEYRPVSLESEGFIHFSTSYQILEVANTFYRKTPNLVILWVDPGLLETTIKWEPPALAHPGSNIQALFPHLYGPLNLDAVVSVVDFETNSEGFFSKIPNT